jgi:type II secretory pathway pseudopilin PulG
VPKRFSRRQGLTLIELTIATVILTVCCGMLTSTITGTMTHNRVRRERQIAVEAARAALEDMHNVDFYDVFWTFNQDPSDDEGGAGTARGAHFSVEGLTPLEDDPDGRVGEIVLPSTTAELFENAENESLGLPRDLNGDLSIDALDHSDDYLLLPVEVRLRWNGIGGPAEFSLSTMLADIRRVE